jgi:hypothetical protein
LALQGVSDGYRQIDGVEQFALLVAERSEPGGAVALVESDLVHMDPTGDFECALLLGILIRASSLKDRENTHSGSSPTDRESGVTCPGLLVPRII